jgi:hypothetical protein
MFDPKEQHRMFYVVDITTISTTSNTISATTTTITTTLLGQDHRTSDILICAIFIIQGAWVHKHDGVVGILPLLSQLLYLNCKLLLFCLLLLQHSFFF